MNLGELVHGSETNLNKGRSQVSFSTDFNWKCLNFTENTQM